MKNLRLTHKIVLMLCIAIGVTLIVFLNQFFLTTSIVSMYKANLHEADKDYQNVFEIVHITADMQGVVQRLMREKDIDSIDFYLSKNSELVESAYEKIDSLKSNDKNFLNKFNALVSADTQTINLLLLGEVSQAYQAYIQRCNPAFEELIDGILDFKESVSARVDSSIVESQTRQKKAMFIVFLIALAGMGASCIAGFVFAKSLMGTLRQIIVMLKDIVQGEGNLTKRIHVQGGDELSEMSMLFNRFIEQQQMIIRKITSSSSAVLSSVNSLKSISDRISDNANELASKSVNVASTAEQASANTNSISTATEEMSSSITSIATSIEEMTASLNEVAKNSQKESDFVSQVDSQAANTQSHMRKLDKASREIGSILEAIRKIADQTNLLALNATIEAASAGEHGRGFAVVASEVKDLAKQAGR